MTLMTRLELLTLLYSYSDVLTQEAVGLGTTRPERRRDIDQDRADDYV